MDCSTTGFLVHHQIPQLAQIQSIKSELPSNHLILCHRLLLLPSIFPTIRVFSNESVIHIMWPKYWSFSISPCNEYSGLISFMIDWFDLLAVQGTLKSLLQHHSLKASILCCLAFYMIQLTSVHHCWKNYWSGLPFPSPGIFLTQGLNLGLLHCRQILYCLSHQGSPNLLNGKKIFVNDIRD